MQESEDIGKRYSLYSLIVSILGISLTILGGINFETLIILIILTISAIVIVILSFYVNKTKHNTKDITEIKENFKIMERLNKLEVKVFKR